MLTGCTQGRTTREKKNVVEEPASLDRRRHVGLPAAATACAKYTPKREILRPPSTKIVPPLLEREQAVCGGSPPSPLRTAWLCPTQGLAGLKLRLDLREAKVGVLQNGACV